MHSTFYIYDTALSFTYSIILPAVQENDFAKRIL